MDNLTAKISNTLKLLRSQRGWSLDTTSQKTGVSKAMLGQIERGESNPTIAVLWKIASGFEVSFSSLIEDIGIDNNTKSTLHSKGEFQKIHPKDDKITVMTLFPYDKELGLEVFIIELLPSCEHHSPPHQHGVVEHVIVTFGEIEVLINGNWKKVKENEGLRFNANGPHGYRNISASKASFHNIIHYSKLGLT